MCCYQRFKFGYMEPADPEVVPYHEQRKQCEQFPTKLPKMKTQEFFYLNLGIFSKQPKMLPNVWATFESKIAICDLSKTSMWSH